MKLNTTGISIIKGNKALWEDIRVALNISIGAMYRYVRYNDENLTKAASMILIKQATGLEDSDILEEEKINA